VKSPYRKFGRATLYIDSYGLLQPKAFRSFSLSGSSLATFVAVGVLLLTVASAASCLPARRAMQIDPILALRED